MGSSSRGGGGGGAYESKITEGKVAELLWKEDITLSFAVAGLKLGICLWKKTAGLGDFFLKERDLSLAENRGSQICYLKFSEIRVSKLS